MSEKLIDQIEISMDKSRFDLPMIFKYLKEESYWAKDRSEKAIRRSIDHSLCFGVYHNDEQIGFGRAVTDHAVVYYLADIFILPEYQGHGIGKKLMQFILGHEDLTGMRGILTTQTGHTFYEQFGFDRDNDIVRNRMMTRDASTPKAY